MTNTALPLFTPDASVPITDPHHITASPVADEYRINFWPQHFGGIPQWIILEPTAFAWMDRFCPDYIGGIWNFYTLNPAMQTDESQNASGRHWTWWISACWTTW